MFSASDFIAAAHIAFEDGDRRQCVRLLRIAERMDTYGWRRARIDAVWALLGL